MTARQLPYFGPLCGPLLGITLLTVAGCETATRTSTSLTPSEQVLLRDRAENLLLAAAESDVGLITCNAIEALQRVDSRQAIPRFHAATGSSVPMVRFAGCVAIGETRDKRGLSHIRRCLRDANLRVRMAAAYAAYRLGEKRYAHILTTSLRQSNDELVRADAAYLLGRMGESRARKQLRGAIKSPLNTNNARVLIHCYGALAMLGDQDAMLRLIDYTRVDVFSRVLALQMLAEVADPRTQNAMGRYFVDKDAHLETRLVAARGLAQMRLKRKDRQTLRAFCERHLRHVGRNKQDPHETSRVRQLAAFALGALGDEQSLEPLSEVAADRSDERTQVAAALAICEIVDS